MVKNYHNYHVLTMIVFIVVLMTVTFSTNQPVILISIFALITGVFISSGEVKKYRGAMLLFIPLAALNIIMNMIFVWDGRIILFYLLGKKFTLEALIYALMMAGKLLIVIDLFGMLGFMVDSDRAVSYFSGIMPKSTLMVMIGLKLIPNMKLRLKTIQQVYSLRGVRHEKENKREFIMSHIPILSVLLENSLEGAFDIGEAAFVRGFLSEKRTKYDREHFKRKDVVILIVSLVFLFLYVILRILHQVEYDMYASFSIHTFLNIGTAACAILTMILLFLLKFAGEK